MKFSSIACLAIFGAMISQANADVLSTQNALENAIKKVEFYTKADKTLEELGRNITAENPLKTTINFSSNDATLKTSGDDVSKLAKALNDIFEAGADVVFGSSAVSAKSGNNVIKITGNDSNARGIKQIEISDGTNTDTISKMKDGSLKITKNGTDLLSSLTKAVFDTFDALISNPESKETGEERPALQRAKDGEVRARIAYAKELGGGSSVLETSQILFLNEQLKNIQTSLKENTDLTQKALKKANEEMKYKTQKEAKAKIIEAFNAAANAVQSSAGNALDLIKAFGKALSDAKVESLVNTDTWDKITELTISTDLQNASDMTKFKANKEKISKSLEFIGSDLEKLKDYKLAAKNEFDLKNTLAGASINKSVLKALQDSRNQAELASKAIKNKDLLLDPKASLKTLSDEKQKIQKAFDKQITNAKKESGDLKKAADKLDSTAANAKFLTAANSDALKNISNLNELDKYLKYKQKIQEAKDKLNSKKIVVKKDDSRSILETELSRIGLADNSNKDLLGKVMENWGATAGASTEKVQTGKEASVQKLIDDVVKGINDALTEVLTALNNIDKEVGGEEKIKKLKDELPKEIANLEIITKVEKAEQDFMIASTLRANGIKDLLKDKLSDKQKVILDGFAKISGTNLTVQDILTNSSTEGTDDKDAISKIAGLPTIIKTVDLQSQSLNDVAKTLNTQSAIETVKISSNLNTNTRLAKLTNPFGNDFELAKNIKNVNLAASDEAMLADIIKEYTKRFETENNLWGNIFGAKGEIKNSANPSVFGISLGYDKALDDAILGISANFAKSKLKSNVIEQRSDNYQFDLYARKYIGASEIDASVYAGFAKNNLNRYSLPDISLKIQATSQKADYDSNIFGLKLNYGYVIDIENGLFFKPLIGINYDYVSNKTFSETGDIAAKFSSISTKIVNAKIGVEARKYIDESNYFFAQPSLETEIYKKVTDSVVSFVGADGSDIRYANPSKKNTYFGLQTGLDTKITDNLSSVINLGLKLNADSKFYNASFGLKYSF